MDFWNFVYHLVLPCHTCGLVIVVDYGVDIIGLSNEPSLLQMIQIQCSSFVYPLPYNGFGLPPGVALCLWPYDSGWCYGLYNYCCLYKDNHPRVYPLPYMENFLPCHASGLVIVALIVDDLDEFPMKTQLLQLIHSPLSTLYEILDFYQILIWEKLSLMLDLW